MATSRQSSSCLPTCRLSSSKPIGTIDAVPSLPSRSFFLCCLASVVRVSSSLLSLQLVGGGWWTGWSVFLLRVGKSGPRFLLVLVLLWLCEVERAGGCFERLGQTGLALPKETQRAMGHEQLFLHFTLSVSTCHSCSPLSVFPSKGPEQILFLSPPPPHEHPQIK